MKCLKIVSLFALALLFGSCATTALPERQQRPTPYYFVEVRPVGNATVTDDGFVARFDFEVVSPQPLDRNALVQELHQTTTYALGDGSTRERTLTLVEAFLLRLARVDARGNHYYRIGPGHHDRHTIYGLENLPDRVAEVEVERYVFAYVGNVAGAEFTPRGFAQLPMNEDGSFVSITPESFNRDYQENYETRGSVSDSGDALGVTYRLHYQLNREDGGRPRFTIGYHAGEGVVQVPVVLTAR